MSRGLRPGKRLCSSSLHFNSESIPVREAGRYDAAVSRVSIRRARPAYGAPFLAGHEVELLVDGGPYFKALLEQIGAAERSIYVESYILKADHTGRRVTQALREKAKAGLEVALSYDGFGSLGLDPEFIHELRSDGVKLLEYRPLLAFDQRPWQARNHRKLCVLDGRIGIIGGMNISNDYAAIEDGGRGWHDTAVLVRGPAVVQLERMFLELWRTRRAERLRSSSQEVPEAFPGGEDVRFVGTHSRAERAEVRNSYLRAILNAKRSIRITNAYFNPDRGIYRALKRAAHRGIEVELVLGGETDVRFVLHVSRGLYAGLLKSGVKIYEWNERVLHSKTAVIDGEWSTVGSANLNHRMAWHDLEVNAIVRGAKTAGALEAQFADDRARSTAIDPKAWLVRPIGNRVVEWSAGLFRRLI